MNQSIALMIFGEPGSTRNALTEEKYRNLATYFFEKDFIVDSILYHDSLAKQFETDLLKYNAILVWVNPIEQGGDRRMLDSLLAKLSNKGCFISTHPDTILKLGTKEILYDIRNTDFGGDTRLYRSFADFKTKFLENTNDLRILKQYRGNGGNGIFKIDLTNIAKDQVSVTHAQSNETEHFSTGDFFLKFEKYFLPGGMLIDQSWNANLINGMVRCYLSGNKVSGFGYQEINALHPSKKPGQRYYFTEDCGLFRDLRNIMENKWISDLQDITNLNNDMLPVIWDADFFINSVNAEDTSKKYSLCEINTSCVSPFPESSIPYIFEEVNRRLNVNDRVFK